MEKNKTILITGGCGFIGTNAADYYFKKGFKVVVFDNLSRVGSKENLKYLKTKKGIIFVKGDIRNSKQLESTFKKYKPDYVLHLAAQVTMVTSVQKPREDFEINALGTFNVLEAIRKAKNNPILIYSSTNKVYGELEDLKIIEGKTRYEFKDLKNGVSEERILDFHSPYGCSKGCADQYVRDYARIYGINTIVFRQSCIYGPHQFGVEDQGWVAWFIIALTLGKKITIYGNGKQVRDLLFIEDLIEAYDLAAKNIKRTKGQIYNIGGGNKNTVSIWFDFRPILEELFKKKIDAKFSNWRPGDQPIYVSDIRKAKRDFGWEPRTNVRQGIKKLYDWVSANKKSFNV
jgi:CDP-paratose 2-epimerase